ncbi:MAG: hypothetical protein KDE56_31260 [Anaerolineales bacterium]|nr:hypothetical protein [Anaerolineales bacterium]
MINSASCTISLEISNFDTSSVRPEGFMCWNEPYLGGETLRVFVVTGIVKMTHIGLSGDSWD